MKAVPAEIASTMPSAVTVATASLLLLQLSLLLVALSGVITGSSGIFSPTVNYILLSAKEIELTGISIGVCWQDGTDDRMIANKAIKGKKRFIRLYLQKFA